MIVPIAGERLEQGDLCCWGTDGKIYKLRSVPPLDNNSIMAGFDPIESEGDINPIGVIRSKPFMQSNDSQDYEGQEGHKEQ